MAPSKQNKKTTAPKSTAASTPRRVTKIKGKKSREVKTPGASLRPAAAQSPRKTRKPHVPTPVTPPTRTLPARRARNSIPGPSSSPSVPTAPEQDHRTPIDCTAPRCRASVVHVHPPGLQFYSPKPEYAVDHKGYANADEAEVAEGRVPEEGATHGRDEEEQTVLPSGEDRGESQQVVALSRGDANEREEEVVSQGLGQDVLGFRTRKLADGHRGGPNEDPVEEMVDSDGHDTDTAGSMADEYHEFLAEYGGGVDDEAPSLQHSNGFKSINNPLAPRDEENAVFQLSASASGLEEPRTPPQQTSNNMPSTPSAPGRLASLQEGEEAAHTPTPQKQHGESTNYAKSRQRDGSQPGTPSTIRLFTPERESDGGAPQASVWGHTDDQIPISMQDDDNLSQFAESVLAVSDHGSDDEDPVLALERMAKAQLTEAELAEAIQEIYGQAFSMPGGAADGDANGFDSENVLGGEGGSSAGPSSSV